MAPGEALGRIQAAFMGGEYLPDLYESEVEIAWVEIESSTFDVTILYGGGDESGGGGAY